MSSLLYLRIHMCLLVIQCLSILIAVHYFKNPVIPERKTRPLKQRKDYLSSFQTNQLSKRCPPGWCLHVIRNPTSSASQACFAENTTEWFCCDGWEHVGNSPSCAKIPNKTDQPVVSPLFVNIPYTGGSVIAPFFPDVYAGRKRNNHHENRGQEGSYYKFSMIRHPCTRLIEFWKQHTNYSSEKVTAEIDTHFTESFNAFIEYAFNDNENNNFLNPQTDELFEGNGDYEFDQLLVFERLEKSLELLGERLGVKISSLQRQLGDQRKKVTCEKIYSVKTWVILRRKYMMDFCVLGYSNNISHADLAPPVYLTTATMNTRYRQCKANLVAPPIFVAKGGLNVTSEVKTTKSCAIYTYYDRFVNRLRLPQKEEEKLLDIWKDMWTSAGWEPHVISEKEAKRHPNFHHIVEKFKSFPTVNKKSYELACYMRYLAMAVVGGGWMSDYDVLPVDMPSCALPVKKNVFTVYGGFVPALTYGTSAEYTRVARLMADIDWKSTPYFKSKNESHVSDMLCMKKLAEEGLIHSAWMLFPAAVMFNLPFDCNNVLSTTFYNEHVRQTGQRSLTIFAIHYSHSFMKASVPFAASQNWNVKVIGRSEYIRNTHEFYMRECKQARDKFNVTVG